MAQSQIQLPTIQNWSCHSCSGCCRQHEIEVTPEEKARIEQQNWTAADGIPADRPLFVPLNSVPWSKQFRLGHQSDGACIFLDEQGLCRIHAKFGEPAKPLACRVYPYAFHPRDKKVTVSLRFSCPSVVANKGKSMVSNAAEIRTIAKAVLPEKLQAYSAPAIKPGEQLGWPDFLKFVDRLDETFAQPGLSTLRKILQALFWMHLVGEATFVKVQGDRLRELLDIITTTAVQEVPTDLGEFDPPSRTGMMPFRLLVAQYARKDTTASSESGWRGRWRMLRAATRFAKGRGTTPVLQGEFREVPFEAMDRSFGPLPEEADEILTRYFRVKIQSLHFCGPAYYDVPLVEGFHSLILVYPAVLWIARWLAASDDRENWTVNDISRALAIADHHHGFSPLFGSGPFRRRIRILNRLGDIPKLCVAYSGEITS